MALLGTRLYLGFDASAVTAAALGEGLGGRRVARASSGCPSSRARSPRRPRGRTCCGGTRCGGRPPRGRGAGGGRATLVLPDGVARVALVDLPEGADAARLRPLPSGPLAALPGGGGDRRRAARRAAAGWSGAAVRRATVAEYEQAAVGGAGSRSSSVHLAPLVALAGLMRSGARDAVHAVLGDVAMCLAAFRGGVPVASATVVATARRARRRGCAGGLADVRTSPETERDPVRLVVSGAAATRLRRELGGESAERGLEGPGGVARRGRGGVARRAASS